MINWNINLFCRVWKFDYFESSQRSEQELLPAACDPQSVCYADMKRWFIQDLYIKSCYYHYRNYLTICGQILKSIFSTSLVSINISWPVSIRGWPLNNTIKLLINFTVHLWLTSIFI